MRKLTILYDSSCDFCQRCRRWMLYEATFLELEFLSRCSLAAIHQYPTLVRDADFSELLVVNDEGQVYRGAKAFIMCLYATKRYRSLSLLLAKRGLIHFARRAFEFISKRRYLLSRCFRRSIEDDIVDMVNAQNVQAE